MHFIKHCQNTCSDYEQKLIHNFTPSDLLMRFRLRQMSSLGFPIHLKQAKLSYYEDI
jgi:hypothetical protein